MLELHAEVIYTFQFSNACGNSPQSAVSCLKVKVDKSAKHTLGTLIGLICVHSVELGWIKWLINAN